MQTLLWNVIAALALKILKVYWEKEEVKNVARLEIYNEFLEAQLRAEKWANDARARDPVMAALLRVRGDGAKTIVSVDPSA